MKYKENMKINSTFSRSFSFYFYFYFDSYS